LATSGEAKLFCISIENAETFHRFKVITEDLAYMAFDQVNRGLSIEGVRFRYRIRAEDVVDIKLVQGGGATATAVAVNIGNARLNVALQHDSVLYELKRQTVGAKDSSLTKKIRQTLTDE
jgi:hypothetical protein